MASRSSINAGGAAGETKPRNGIVKTRVICPEMCCYCFDILIGYIQGKKANSCMKNYFTNDE